MKRQIGTVASGAALLLAGVLIPAGVAAGATTGTTSRPRISVSRATNLASGQIVVIKGSGFPERRDVFLQECPRGATLRSQCSSEGEGAFAFTGAKRTFDVPMQVLRYPFGAKGLDCATRLACEIGAFTLGKGSDQVVAGAVSISFSTTAATITPLVRVSPSRSLTPNQFVTITGSGFAPAEEVELSQCSGLTAKGSSLFEHCDSYYYGGGPGGPGGPEPVGDPGGFSNQETNAKGAFVATIRANSNVLIQFRHLRAANCEVAPGCEFAISTFDPADPNYLGIVPLTFNPAAKPITPVMTLSSSSSLADGQMVTLTGGPFPADGSVIVRECPTTTSLWNGCAIIDEMEATANGSGSIDVTFPVVEKAGTGAHATDCTREPCSISIIESNDIWYSAWTPITFDPSLPAIRPASTVSPATGLESGSLVTVTGSEFAPGAPIDVSECVRHSTNCHELEFGVPADATGGVDFGAEVVSSIEVFNADGPDEKTVACGKDHCILVVANSDDPQQGVRVPISFSAS